MIETRPQITSTPGFMSYMPLMTILLNSPNTTSSLNRLMRVSGMRYSRQ
jgi:hypothetical protein